MSKVLTDLLSNFIMVCSLLYIWHKLLNQKLNYKNHKLYVTLIFIMIFSILNYFITDKFLRIILLTFVFMIFFKYLFNKNLQKCIITPIFYQLIIMISETIYILFIAIFMNANLEKLLNTYLGTFMTNIVITLISVIIINFKFVKLLYNKIISFTDNIRQVQLLSFSLITIVALSVFPITIYYKVDIRYLLIFYSTMIVLLCFIIFYSFRTQNQYNKVSSKYNVAINSLKEYENMMSKYRIVNHENKNLLLTIRAMIINKEKDIPKYIDTMINNKYDDDEKLLFEMNVIPSGGLRATIYSEILKIRENNLKYSLDIDRKLSTIDLIELDENTIIDICKIICVFIDNAIEEVINLKDKKIQIQLYLENNNIYIKVSNNYKNPIEIEKIYEKGYTSKGENHGYGLALVKSIVDKNNLLQNNIELTKNVFSQILIIKYKKTHQ